jgi:hypothetical protein
MAVILNTGGYDSVGIALSLLPRNAVNAPVNSSTAERICYVLLDAQYHRLSLFRRKVLKTGNWHENKHDMITRHLKSFLRFIKSINFDQL